MTATAPLDEPPVGLGRNRDYQLVWFAGAVSGFGDVVFLTATVVWVGAIIAKGQSWAPLAVSGVLLAAMVPAVLLGPIGGVYADRWNRRRIMLATDLLRAVVVGSLILVPAVGGHLAVGVKLALIFTAVAVASAVTQFFRPARFALFGTVVADPDRERAGSIAQGTDATTAILGPPLAAPLVVGTGYGVQWALAINALSFLVSFVAVLAMRRTDPRVEARERKPRSLREDLSVGLRFVLGSRTMLVIVSAVVLVTFGAGAVNVLDLFFVTDNLHVQVGYYGLLDAAIGIGIVLGSIIFAAVGRRISAPRVFSFGLVLCGLGLAGYSRSTALWAAVLLLFLVGIPLAGVNSMIGPMIFREVPRELLGRVLGLLNPVQQIASAGAIVLSTWLASTVLRTLDAHVLGVHFGPVDTIFFGGGVLVVMVGLWAIGAVRGMATAPVPAVPNAGPEPASTGPEIEPSSTVADAQRSPDGAGVDGIVAVGNEEPQ